MSLISADAVLARTIQLMNDTSIDLGRVRVPKPVIFPPLGKKKPDYKLTHAQRECMQDARDLFPSPVLMWDVERPDFVIDESDLPY